MIGFTRCEAVRVTDSITYGIRQVGLELGKNVCHFAPQIEGGVHITPSIKALPGCSPVRVTAIVEKRYRNLGISSVTPHYAFRTFHNASYHRG